MATPILSRLAAAGFQVQKLPPAQRAALSKLSETEFQTLLRIKARLETEGAATVVKTAAGDTIGYVIF